MSSMRIENCLLKYEEHEIPLLAGEFHYWRVLRENWPAVIAQIKAMGLQVVSSYIPWNYHELEPGSYDFSGKTSPQRDLRSFVELLEREGLWLIIRPGPYIYSEWPFGGVPARAAQHHRLSAEFLAMARDYIENVCEVLVPKQITRGGNIILFQADNEPYPPIESFGDEMGCFGEPGLFKEWLQKEYADDLDALNASWRSAYKSFQEPCFHFHEAYVNTNLPLADRLLPHPEYYTRYADSHRFIGWYSAKIILEVKSWLQNAGVDVPVYANSWSPLYQDFTLFDDAVSLTGTDIYPSAYMAGDSAVEDDWSYVVDIVKMQEADVSNGNVWSAEYQSGLYPIQAVGYLPPAHYRYVDLTLMARGLKGWNWYMLVNRDNWYHCPINEWGRANEYFPVHKEIVNIAHAVEPWHTCELYDLALFCYKPHRVIAPGNFKACFDALECADLSYAYYDPAAKFAAKSACLLYAGAEWITEEIAATLNDYVDNGGTLIFFNQFPFRNEKGQPLQNLKLQSPDGARPVGLPVTVTVGNSHCTMEKGGHCGSKVNFFYYRQVEGSPVRLLLSTEAKELLVDIGAVDAKSFNIGYVQEKGQGRIVQIGSNPSAELLQMVVATFSAGRHVSCQEADISTRIHRHVNGDLMLFVTNRSDSSRTALIALNLALLGVDAEAALALRQLPHGEAAEIKGIELAELSVPLAPRGAEVYRISSS